MYTLLFVTAASAAIVQQMKYDKTDVQCTGTGTPDGEPWETDVCPTSEYLWRYRYYLEGDSMYSCPVPVEGAQFSLLTFNNKDCSGTGTPVTIGNECVAAGSGWARAFLTGTTAEPTVTVNLYSVKEGCENAEKPGLTGKALNDWIFSAEAQTWRPVFNDEIYGDGKDACAGKDGLAAGVKVVSATPWKGDEFPCNMNYVDTNTYKCDLRERLNTCVPVFMGGDVIFYHMVVSSAVPRAASPKCSFGGFEGSCVAAYTCEAYNRIGNGECSCGDGKVCCAKDGTVAAALQQSRYFQTTCSTGADSNCAWEYTVKRGDTLSAIACNFNQGNGNVSGFQARIQQYNGGAQFNPNALAIGQKIRVPCTFTDKQCYDDNYAYCHGYGEWDFGMNAASCPRYSSYGSGYRAGVEGADESSGLSTSVIIGIVAGAVALLCIAACALIGCMFMMRRSHAKPAPVAVTGAPHRAPSRAHSRPGVHRSSSRRHY